jgi:hypothetical protein
VVTDYREHQPRYRLTRIPDGRVLLLRAASPAEARQKAVKLWGGRWECEAIGG